MSLLLRDLECEQSNESLLPSQDDDSNGDMIGTVRSECDTELKWTSCCCSSSARRHLRVCCQNVSLADNKILRKQYLTRSPTNNSLWKLVLVASVLLPSSCRALQFPSLFDNRGATARQQQQQQQQHAGSTQTKHRGGLFGVALTPPPTTQCATTFPSEVYTEPTSKVRTISEAPKAIDYPCNINDHHDNNNINNYNGEQVELSLLGQVPSIPTSEEPLLSDSWWEDDENETEKATVIAEEKRNRMIKARSEILFDRTSNNQQRPTSNAYRRRDEATSICAPSRKATSKGAASQILMGAIRKAAVASSATSAISSGESNAVKAETVEGASGVGPETAKQRAARSSRSIIESTISDLLDQQLARQERDLRNEIHDSLHGPLRPDGWPIGILGDSSKASNDRHIHYPMPGTILMHPTLLSYTYQNNNPKNGHHQDYANSVTVRVATPLDDVDIALLRLSVFSGFPEDVQQQFCSRSCEALANRRLRGATCLVATSTAGSSPLPITKDEVAVATTAVRGGSRPEIVLGSVECSFHEFKNTMLGKRRPERSILYITEFAVSPTVRRRGIGARLLQAVDELANLRQVESLYLHVDVTNHAALSLYNRAGYKRVTSKDTMFDEFTTSLNLHDGATKGRKHFLLCKHFCDNPTWLPSLGSAASAATASARSLVFGFEMPV